MPTFQTKFKDRKPEETISIIQKFFNDRKLNIVLDNCNEGESSTWNSRILLQYNGYTLFGANGKGVNKDFCMASAYAEMYERYCNNLFYLGNPFITSKVYDIRKNKYGYYIDKDEKILSYEEAISFPLFQNNLSRIEDCPGQYKHFLNTIYPKGLIGIPFKNPLDENDVKYIDPRMLFIFNTSSGMAAGNSFEEAFNQGASEMVEHYITDKYLNNKIKKYHRIDLNAIRNEKLQAIIKKINESGNKFYLFDFSREYDVPVLMGVLVNDTTHAVTVNFGAFPVFDIACERCITEIYQGRCSYKDMKMSGTIPFRNNVATTYDLRWPTSVALKPMFVEEMILNSQIDNEINYEVFLPSKEYSNIQIYEYFCKLSKKLNFNFYYYNMSKTDDMYAIKIIWDNLHTLTYMFDIADETKQKRECYKMAETFYKLLYNIENRLNYNNEIDAISAYYRKPRSDFDNERNDSFISWLCGNSWESIYDGETNNVLMLIRYLFNNTGNNYYLYEYYLNNKFYTQDLICYLLYKRYEMFNQYSIDEIDKIINFLGFELKEQILETNPYMLFNNLFSKIYLEKINTEEYKHYLEILSEV